MNFLNWFFRNNTEVEIKVNSKLGTCKPIYPFSFDCQDQETAELLARHLNDEFEKFKTEIAKEPWIYLSSYHLSVLKRRLKDWNSKTEMWK